jgi:hypothetical protein
MAFACYCKAFDRWPQVTQASRVFSDYNGNGNDILMNVDTIPHDSIAQDWNEGNTILTFSDGSRLVFRDSDVIIKQDRIINIEV